MATRRIPRPLTSPGLPERNAQKTWRGGAAVPLPVERGAREASAARRPPPCPRGGLRGRRASECARRPAHVRAVSSRCVRGPRRHSSFKELQRSMLMDDGLAMHPPLRKPPSSASPCFLYSPPSNTQETFSLFVLVIFKTFCVTEMLRFIFPLDRPSPGTAGNWFVTGQSTSLCSRCR